MTRAMLPFSSLEPESSGAAHMVSEATLVRMALALGAADVGGALSRVETELVANARRAVRAPSAARVDVIRAGIKAGADPLGAQFYELRSPVTRRQAGAIFTPPLLVEPMVAWAIRQEPTRIIDAGSGSGRFALAVARRSRNVELIAIDIDPVATLLTRAALAVSGHRRAQVIQADYTHLNLPPVGRTAFIGNPPYVRHHNLTPTAKAWAKQAADRAGLTISGLAGLHAYFFLATALIGRSGDVGCFVTSSEWLDVNYGAVIRELLLGQLGGVSIHVMDSTALPFEDTATTAAITCFRVGGRPRSVRLRAVKALEDVGDLESGQPVSRARLSEATRWSPFVRASRKVPQGYIELGELCRVHRGAVTGLNSVWVTNQNQHRLPDRVLFSTVTRARELFAAGAALYSLDGLRMVIDIPEDLDVLEGDDLRLVERFLRKARRAGAARGYIAEHRRAWWSVGLRNPAPILATYMARRPPAFVRNLAEARHINIAHGLYPRVAIPDSALERLVGALRNSITVAQGRTYAGGLTKFEPREMERLLVPDLPMLLGR